jgi:hypothetical protein
MIVVIDDERTFVGTGCTDPPAVYARTSNEGIAAVANAWTNYVLRYGNMVDLYLDHDLGEDDTIMPVVDFLYVAGMKSGIMNPVDLIRPTDFIANIFIHSQNPTAGDTIIPLLSPLYKNVQRIPLPDLI